MGLSRKEAVAVTYGPAIVDAIGFIGKSEALARAEKNDEQLNKYHSKNEERITLEINIVAAHGVCPSKDGSVLLNHVPEKIEKSRMEVYKENDNKKGHKVSSIASVDNDNAVKPDQPSSTLRNRK